MSGTQPDVRQNAGRCDICGKPIVMEDGDEFTTSEFGVFDEDVREEHGLSDQDAADAVADALERIDDSPEAWQLAQAIRENLAFGVHKSCLEDTNYSELEEPA
jgi:hypothetical protein